MGPDQNLTEYVAAFWSAVVGGVNVVDRCVCVCVCVCVWKGIFMQQCSNFCHHCFMFHLNSWSHLILEDPTVTYTVYCCAPPLMVFQDLSLWAPEKYEHHFPCWWLCFELLFDLWCQKFTVHALVLSLWLMWWIHVSFVVTVHVRNASTLWQ